MTARGRVAPVVDTVPDQRPTPDARPAPDPRPSPDRRPAPLQRRVALVVVLWAISEPLLLDGTASRWVALGFGLLVTLPLLLSRRAPIVVAIVIAVAYLVQYALGDRMEDAMSPELALAFGLFGVAAYAPASIGRSVFALSLAAAVPAGLWVISALDLGKVERIYTSQYLYLAAVVFAGVLPGLALRSRQREVDALEGEVQALCARAATEIGVAVDGERRALSHDLVRVVDGLVDEIRGLVVEARRTVGTAESSATAFGGRMADAAGRAADELRALLQTLTGPSSERTSDTPPTRRRLRRPTGTELRNLAGLAFPVVGLAALGVADRMQLPTLPVTLPTTDGGSLTVGTSAVAPAVGYLLAVLTPVGLLLRRRAPVVAVATVAAFLVLRALLDELSSLTISQVFVCGALTYNAGAWPRTRWSALVGLAIALTVTVTCWALEQYRFDTLVYAYMVAVLLGTWTIGRAVRNDLRDALALRTRAAVLRTQRDRLCRVAIRGERRDVAREMHDVVGHGLSLIVVQSGVVDVLAARDPDRARDALDLVEGATRTTQAELEALHTALGSPSGPAGPARSCSRTLERIVDDARGAGQPVLAYIDPRVDELAPDHRTAVVRIAQEALTNARKHAGAAPATLEVEVRADRVRLQVLNEAGTPLLAVPRGSHFGLRGMAERAEARGGRLEAGPDGDGGWAVRAELPRDTTASLVGLGTG